MGSIARLERTDVKIARPREGLSVGARRRRASTPSQETTRQQVRGVGKPGFPMSQLLLEAAGAPTGRGAVRQAHRRWGNPVSPYFHISVVRRSRKRYYSGRDLGIASGEP